MKRIILASLITINLLGEELNIDSLLDNIELKTDLSEKTKLENGGISYIYTREDIRRMQAHNLKDILKSTYPNGYGENNFGISDPYSPGLAIPFSSSSIKIYIDNQEITTGLYGSGLNIYGDMDIDFVDHIEIYSGNPTFEYSTESALTLVKLYSKSAQKDTGNKVSISSGSYGTKAINAYNSDILDNDWSYFSYASYTDYNRKKYKNSDAILSRDSQTTHLFSSFHNENNNILIDIISQKKDTLLAQSVFATPNDSSIDNNYLHVGYDTHYDDFTFLLSFEKHDMITNFEDKNKDGIKYINDTYAQNIPYSLETDSKSIVFTSGINYNISSESNNLLLGVKYRYKQHKYDVLSFNNTSLGRRKSYYQKTATTFMENQYSLTENSIFTSGVSYSNVKNEDSIQEDNLYSFRFGLTYTSDSITSKTIVSTLESTVDPYLISSIYLSDPDEKIKKVKQVLYIQELKYEQEVNKYNLMFAYISLDNQLVPNQQGLLQSNTQTTYSKNFMFRYMREYNKYDKLEITIGANHINNSPNTDSMEKYAATLRNFNTYEKFDFFNEVLFYRENQEKQNYFDYSAGIIYHQSDDLTFSIKGTNILNKAIENKYIVLDFTTLESTTPLSISPIDKKFILNMGYTF